MPSSRPWTGGSTPSSLLTGSLSGPAYYKFKGYYEEEKVALARAEAELEKLKEAASRRRGAPQEPEKKEEVSPHVLLCQQHAEDRAEITARLGKIEKTMKGVVEVLGMLANAIGGVAISKSPCATPSGGCKRKHDGRGGDRKSALYKLQKQMGPTAAPQLK